MQSIYEVIVDIDGNYNYYRLCTTYDPESTSKIVMALEKCGINIIVHSSNLSYISTTL